MRKNIYTYIFHAVSMRPIPDHQLPDKLRHVVLREATSDKRQGEIYDPGSSRPTALQYWPTPPRSERLYQRMFLPEDDGATRKAEDARNAGYAQVEAWSLDLIPADIRTGAIVSVQEVQCGDPTCAPIDTAVTIVFESGGGGMFGIPAEAKDVEQKHIKASFPDNEVLSKWSRGEEAEWPPMDGGISADGDLPELRFEHRSRVECRIGPDEVTGWAPGTIIKLWYRDTDWPPGSFAPYQIELDDGRLIFAPADIDRVIRKAS